MLPCLFAEQKSLFSQIKKINQFVTLFRQYFTKYKCLTKTKKVVPNKLVSLDDFWQKSEEKNFQNLNLCSTALNY